MHVKVCKRGKRDVVGPATRRSLERGNPTARDHDVVRAVRAGECDSVQHDGTVTFFYKRPPQVRLRSFVGG
jgi:hypothetical protein